MITPRASTSTSHSSDSSGPRKLISNEAVTKDNYLSLVTMPKEAPTPSPSAQPSSASGLVSKLRWANIGWYYHWGIKQYDFARGKEEIAIRLRNICREVVRSVPWHDVFGVGCEHLDWGEDGPDWETWDEAYGM